jgi:hypothetical protein
LKPVILFKEFDFILMFSLNLKYSKTCIKRSPLGQRKSGLIRPLKRGSIQMKFSMTGQENSDLLIQVTAWADLTV